MYFKQYLKHFENLQKRQKKFFRVGDYVKIGYSRKRLQFFEGIIIAINGSKITVRKNGVEWIFSYQNPTIQKIEVFKSSKSSFRRSKLFYLRK